jgi:hypothetical protein
MLGATHPTVRQRLAQPLQVRCRVTVSLKFKADVHFWTRLSGLEHSVAPFPRVSN